MSEDAAALARAHHRLRYARKLLEAHVADAPRDANFVRAEGRLAVDVMRYEAELESLEKSLV
jgi:hypothetical protein